MIGIFPITVGAKRVVTKRGRAYHQRVIRPTTRSSPGHANVIFYHCCDIFSPSRLL
jgi:hypothetical protein